MAQTIPFLPFPTPPAGYDVRYMAELTRVFSVFQQQLANPGLGQFTTINLTNVPVYADNTTALAGGLAVGAVYRTATGELRIVI